MVRRRQGDSSNSTLFPFEEVRREMLKPPRWEAEIRLMLKNFPTFKPYAVPGREAGFYGYLVGPHTGTTYRVVIRTPLSDYPEKEPGVYMDPHPERHHWIS